MNQPPAFDLAAFLAYAPTWQGRAHYFATIGSTNQEARLRLGNVPQPAEMLLIADQQTAGRGRLQRTWEAPFGSGLLFTMTIPLAPLLLEKAYLYTASLSLALQQAVAQQTGVALAIKWPNDLLRNGRKCGGILAEVEGGLGPHRAETWLALGCGLNTGLSEQDFAEAGLTERATNIIPPGSPPLRREILLATFLAIFAEYRAKLALEPETVRQEWAARLINLGQAIQVFQAGLITPNSEPSLTGLATGVDPSGALLVVDNFGKTHKVQAGDVSVRLADGKYA